MEPLQSQRRHQVGTHAHSVHAPGEEPARPHALIAAAAAGHQANLPVSAVASLQRSIGNRAVTRMLTGQAGSGPAPLVVQRVGAGATKQSFPDDVLSEHVGTEPMNGISLLAPSTGNSTNPLGAVMAPGLVNPLLELLPPKEKT